MRRIISLSILLFTFCLAGMAQPCNPQSTANGSPCSQQTPATPFCADENPYGVTYPSSTNSPNSSPFTGSNQVDCCYTTPNPAWYYFQIDNSGTLTIHIEQHGLSGGTLDVDFVCWGPFTAGSQTDFVNNLCCGMYNVNNNTVVDCSYSSSWTEDCNLGNVQAGQWYLLLLTNYSNQPGTINFNATTSSTATTNCDLLNSGASNSPICEGSTLELYVTAPQAGATYNWTGPNGFAQSTTNTTLQIPNVSANMTGEFHMNMTGITQNSNEAVVDVTVYPSPTPEIVAERQAICKGESVQLSAGGNHPNYTYKWSAKPMQHGNYSIIANGNTSIEVSPSESYKYVLIAQANECTGIDSIDIIVNPLPVVEITIDNPALCYGESTNITATGGSYYNWSEGSTSSSIHVSPLQTSTYSVEVKTDALCSSDTTVEVIVYPELHSTYSMVPSYCDQPTGEITMTATGGVGNYTYTAPGVTFTDDIANNLHSGVYTITITDEVGCTITQTAEIIAVPGPTPCFIFASTDDVNMVITNCTQGNNTYFWDFGDGVTGIETHPTHEYMDPGRYTVRMVVTDEHNCIDSLYQDYVINGPVYLANAFSPNGDGINDVLYVIGKTIQEQEFLWVIYDRHGSLVFISADPAIGWDGTLFGGKKDAQPGVYVYRLKYKDVNGNYFERDGNITLIR